MWGLSDWGNNYFLLYAARTTGIQGLQAVVASGWVRGAVSGVGLLNLGIAIWEIFHFKQTVAASAETETWSHDRKAMLRISTPNPLPDNERRDEQ